MNHLNVKRFHWWHDTIPMNDKCRGFFCDLSRGRDLLSAALPTINSHGIAALQSL